MHFPLPGVKVSAYGDANRGAGVLGIVHIAIDWLILVIFAVGGGRGGEVASQLKDCQSFSSGRTGVAFVFFFFTLYYLYPPLPPEKDHVLTIYYCQKYVSSARSRRRLQHGGGGDCCVGRRRKRGQKGARMRWMGMGCCERVEPTRVL